MGAQNFADMPATVIAGVVNDCTVLKGKSIPFEIAVGMNGRVWIRARTVKESICLGNNVMQTSTFGTAFVFFKIFKIVSSYQKPWQLYLGMY